MSALLFRARVLLKGINPYVVVPAKKAAKLRREGRRAMPVKVRIHGRPEEAIKTNLMPVGDGSFYLYLNTPMRKAAEARVGDMVLIELESDLDYRSGPVHPHPGLFKSKLQANPEARRGWKRLSPSRQKEILRYFAALKSEEALTRNVEKAVQVLTGARIRFMAREWNAD